MQASDTTVVHTVPQGRGSAGVDADPITTEVIRHGLDAAADQMRIALSRTAFSPVIYEMFDFAAALYDNEVRLLAQAQALPMFLGTMGHCIQNALAQIGGPGELSPGDVIFSTYGYDIGSHQQDATVVLPGFHSGELVGYATVKAHHMDIGAKEPYCTDTVDVFQEGAIFPSVWIYRGGVKQKDMYRTILANSRLPEAFDGDLQAQIGAARTGLAGLDRLITRYGLEEFREACERMFDHGEAVARKFYTSIPDGRYTASCCLDSNGVSDEPVPFEVSVEVSGSDVCVDFSAAPGELEGPMNCPLATTVSAARVAMMTFAGGAASANEGHLRPIAIKTREGTMFDPRPPAPIFLYYWPAMQAVDAIHRALSDARPEAVTAGSGGDLCCFIWWGVGADGEFWGDATDHYVGQGATLRNDGAPPFMHITGSGIRNTPIEVFESRRPVVTERFEYSVDSAGAGRTRGGLGVDIHYRATDDLFITSTVERTTTPPWGLDGGGPAAPNRVRVRAVDGSYQTYGKATGVKIAAGEVVELRTGGGGGFGPPAERAAELVRRDVEDGYITEPEARRHYPHALD
jgi:N-methylhydantoinase B